MGGEGTPLRAAVNRSMFPRPFQALQAPTPCHRSRLRCMRPSRPQHHIEGLSMFPLQFRFVPINAGTFFSFQIDNEGIFIFLAPFELALLWPWVKA